MLDWGHLCNGTAKSDTHLPCLYPDWVESNNSVKCTNEDYCAIWGVEKLKSRPCVQLKWGHIFEVDCILTCLKAKWNFAHVDFSYLRCPLWKDPIECNDPDVNSIVWEDRKFEELVTEVAIAAAVKDGALESHYSGYPYFGDLEKFAIDKFAVYQWYECQKPYPAGLKEWDDRHINKEDWYWPDWSLFTFSQTTGKHYC